MALPKNTKIQIGAMEGGFSLIHSQVTESPCGERSNAEYTIGSKVVAYSRVRAVVCLVVQSAHGLSPHPRVSRKCELTTLWFVLMQIQA
jgi:hypothetical protein